MPAEELKNIDHVQEVVGSIRPGQQLVIIFFDSLAQQCWGPIHDFDQASGNPSYNLTMRFHTINMLNVISTPGNEDMEEFISKRRVEAVPAIAFWDGEHWSRTALVSDDIYTVLERHRPSQ